MDGLIWFSIWIASPILIYFLMMGFMMGLMNRAPAHMLPDCCDDGDFQVFAMLCWPVFICYFIGWFLILMMMPRSR